LHLTAGQLIWSNTSLAGVKVTTVMSAWITMSPLYRVQQAMPTRKSNHRYCRLELPLEVFPALNCPVP